ncbi:MAG TPA: HK97 family phage prohead protease [Nocardioides sp.]|nr:HK97 family phage prohead protease [Nocardioides sp.]
MSRHSGLERRVVAEPVEYRANGSGPGQLHGYAVKWMRLSQDLGGFVERIAPETFNKSLADKARVIARYNHDDGALLGTTDAGTLRVGRDDLGLAYEVDLPDTQAGHDVGTLAARGDVRYSSFAFYGYTHEWGLTDEGYNLRTVTSARLHDVAPVNTPAYLDTTVARRSLAERLNMTIDELDGLTIEQREMVSDEEWGSFSKPGDYTSEQWYRACLIHEDGATPDGPKNLSKLPCREPDGHLNRGGVHACAAMISKVTGTPAAKITAAAKALVAIYRNDLKETPPDSLVALADRDYEPPEIEQRETHSVPASIQLSLRELVEKK